MPGREWKGLSVRIACCRGVCRFGKHKVGADEKAGLKKGAALPRREPVGRL